jgi:hypothetical protein
MSQLRRQQVEYSWTSSISPFVRSFEWKCHVVFPWESMQSCNLHQEWSGLVDTSHWLCQCHSIPWPVMGSRPDSGGHRGNPFTAIASSHKVHFQIYPAFSAMTIISNILRRIPSHVFTKGNRTTIFNYFLLFHKCQWCTSSSLRSSSVSLVPFLLSNKRWVCLFVLPLPLISFHFIWVCHRCSVI